MTAARPNALRPEFELLAPIRGARILIVDDNELNREVAGELLTGAGLVVETAANGADALQKLREVAYDLVFMDLQMPVMDGLAATAAIRRDGPHARLPIVAMTANAMPGDAERCRAAGMDDHVAKPIELERLWHVLLRWIPAKHARAASPDPASTEEPARSAEAPERIPGIDVAAGMRCVADNPALYRSVLRMFVEGHRDDPATVRRAIESFDWVTAERLAHTAKGLAGTIGAHELQERARELEMTLKHAELRGNASAAIASFARSLDAIVTAVEGAVPPIDVPQKPVR